MNQDLLEALTVNKVLDHGYLHHVESYGSDERIIEAARMSTGKGFEGWGPFITDEPCGECEGKGEYVQGFQAHPSPCNACDGDGQARRAGDERLLAYLYSNHHDTPFEMAGMIIEVQAPIFVFREWHRHRTQSYNEMSGRYTPLPDLNYVPSLERLMMGVGGKNKQAGVVLGAEELTEENAKHFQDSLRVSYANAETLYQYWLSKGVTKELARVHLPVARYSSMRASANLRNWLAFLTLRQAPNAQWEIRQYANEVAALIKHNFPRTYDLFCKGRK